MRAHAFATGAALGDVAADVISRLVRFEPEPEPESHA
jgi:hypothetical protein